LVDAGVWALRQPAPFRPSIDADDTGRILFANFRANATSAAAGGTIFTALPVGSLPIA
jgi:hypothetical protein